MILHRVRKSTVSNMEEQQKNKWDRRPLSEQELQELADRILNGEDLPWDNNFDTDVEESDDENDFDTPFPNTFENKLTTKILNSDDPNVIILQDIILAPENSSDTENHDTSTSAQCTSSKNLCNQTGNNSYGEPSMSEVRDNEDLPKRQLRSSVLELEETSMVETKEQPIQEQPARKWKKQNVETKIPDYSETEGIVEELFDESETTPTSVFLKVLGSTISHITFQSNLYAVQRNRNLDLTEKELLTFIGINFFMAYHQLPNWKHYWNGSPDLGIPLVTNAMSRNRFEAILSNIHCNDNLHIPNNNTDKLYKLRPVITKLNENFQTLYKTTRRVSVDESIILFKGRSTLKQYNPQKPIKRGYKIWCLADQRGYISNFEVYQGKNEALENEFRSYGLGERVVLSLTKPHWGKNKIVYFDNFFTSIPLLERLRVEKTLACGTIRSNRKDFPKNLTPDKSLKRGDFDYRY